MEDSRILTFGKGAAPEPQQVEPVPEPELTDDEMDAAMPQPSGFRVLLAMPTVEDTYDGSGIVKATTTIQAESTMSVVAIVVELGPDAYVDPKRFPSGPYCKQGDYVLIAPYQGQRFYVGTKEFRIINDESILGTVVDPRSYRRI